MNYNMNYNTIQDPKTGKHVPITSPRGITIINNYIKASKSQPSPGASKSKPKQKRIQRRNTQKTSKKKLPVKKTSVADVALELQRQNAQKTLLDRKMSEKEHNRIRHVFGEYDTNKDDIISLDELIQQYNAAYGGPKTAEREFTEHDINKNNKLEFNEFEDWSTRSDAVKEWARSTVPVDEMTEIIAEITDRTDGDELAAEAGLATVPGETLDALKTRLMSWYVLREPDLQT